MGRDKLSLPFPAGGTVLERTCSALAGAPLLQRLLVVRSREGLGFDPAVYGFDVLEIGLEASSGMHRTLKRGLARVIEDAEAAMICLGDQPFVRTEDYRRLLSAYADTLASDRDLLYPTRAGNRGNPALIHRRYFQEVFAEPDSDRGCRYLFERHPGRARAWETDIGAFFRDLDTPEDYRSCLN